MSDTGEASLGFFKRKADYVGALACSYGAQWQRELLRPSYHLTKALVLALEAVPRIEDPTCRLIAERLRKVEGLVATVLKARDSSNLGLELHQAGQALQDAIRGLTRTVTGEKKSSEGKLRRKRGRPVTSDREADKRLADGYRSSASTRIKDYATMIHRSYKEVKKAIDRHRQRTRRKREGETK